MPFIPNKSDYSDLISEPFILAVQKGLVPGHTMINKYGSQYDLPADEQVDIWEYGGIDPGAYDYTLIDVGGEPLFISSDNDLDSMIIRMLLNNTTTSEIVDVTLQGQTKTPVGDGRLFTACNSMFNDNHQPTQGNIYLYTDTTITDGKPDDASKIKGYFSAPSEEKKGQQAKQAIYTVPRDCFGYIRRILAATVRKKASSVIITPTFLGYDHQVNQYKVWRDQPDVMLNTVGESAIQATLPWQPLAPGSVFKMTANSDADGAGVTSSYTVLLSKGREMEE